MFPIRNMEDLRYLNEAVSLQNQVKIVRLQDKLGKRNFHDDLTEVFEPLTNTLKKTPENITKTITESFINNNKAISDLNEKILELMNDRGILASCLMCPLSKITNPENTTQFKLIKDSSSNEVNDLKINNSITITLHNNLLTFRDTNKQFELKGDLLKMITNKNYNVNLASLADKKLMYDFAKEMQFDERRVGNKSTRDKTLIKLLNSPAIMASGISKTKILSSDPDEFCDRLRLLLQDKHAGNNSDIINDGIVAIVDKLLEYNCISKQQHKQILIKCNLINK